MIRFFVILTVIAGLQECAALKDIVVKFPDHVSEGGDIEMTCQYDLEDGNFYYLKWYKGPDEFFNYFKNFVPPITVLNVENVHVDIPSSSRNTIKLLNVSHDSNGNYTCEVASDHLTLSNYKTLKVEPADKNFHTVIPSTVRISDSVKLSCSYNPTKYNTPLKSVTWQKNGKVFYKYEPDSEINVAVQAYPGIKFSVKQNAKSSEVTLHNATADTEDVYTCQIDYPASTLKSSGFLLVKEKTPGRVNVIVPALVNYGDNVKLRCQFNFDESTINKVKWFKNDREFYSYTPDEDPTITPSEGVDVQDLITSDVYRTFVSVVLLKNVTIRTAGRYKCQVSTNNGSSLHMASKNLAMYQIPEGGPTVVVEDNSLRIGDYVNAHCISPPSYPYADITWLLNGNEVAGDLRQEYKPVGFPSPSSSGLSQIIDFNGGSHAELTCIVTIADVYRREKSVTIEKDPSNAVTPSIDHNHVYFSAMESGAHSWTKTSVATIIISSVLLLNW